MCRGRFAGIMKGFAWDVQGCVDGAGPHQDRLPGKGARHKHPRHSWPSSSSRAACLFFALAPCWAHDKHLSRDLNVTSKTTGLEDPALRPLGWQGARPPQTRLADAPDTADKRIIRIDQRRVSESQVKSKLSILIYRMRALQLQIMPMVKPVRMVIAFRCKLRYT